jgi:hypothetical protein
LVNKKIDPTNNPVKEIFLLVKIESRILMNNKTIIKASSITNNHCGICEKYGPEVFGSPYANMYL